MHNNFSPSAVQQNTKESYLPDINEDMSNSGTSSGASNYRSKLKVHFYRRVLCLSVCIFVLKSFY
jgi:hypothetical protein